MRRKPAAPARSGIQGQLTDVSEHLDQLRTHYFDIVSVDADEVIVRLRPKAEVRAIGFRSSRTK